MNTSELLKSAAKELAFYIDAENARLKKEIQCTDLDPPDYHDHQTCAELYELACSLDCDHCGGGGCSRCNDPGMSFKN